MCAHRGAEQYYRVKQKIALGTIVPLSTLGSVLAVFMLIAQTYTHTSLPPFAYLFILATPPAHSLTTFPSSSHLDSRLS